MALLDFADGTVLQAVWCCRPCSVAGRAVLQAVQCCRLCGVVCRRRGIAGGERAGILSLISSNPSHFVDLRVQK